VGQPVLQGFDFAPPAGLCGLHNTRLEPTHGVKDPGPVDPMPVCHRAGSRTSRWISCPLPCLLSRVAKRSCGGNRRDGAMRRNEDGKLLKT
jgi:hypothetical protein